VRRVTTNSLSRSSLHAIHASGSELPHRCFWIARCVLMACRDFNSDVAPWAFFCEYRRESDVPSGTDVDRRGRYVRKVPNCDMMSVVQFGISGCKSGERSRSMVVATGSPGNASKIVAIEAWRSS
jgi:hypothetical protein